MSKRRSKYHITACMIVTRKYVASGHERHIRYIPTCTSCWLYKWCRSIDNYVELHNFTFVRNANIVPFYLTCKEIFIGSIFFLRSRFVSPYFYPVVATRDSVAFITNSPYNERCTEHRRYALF